MITELYKFRKSMASWGIIPEDKVKAYHPRFQAVPEPKKHLEVKIGPDGLIDARSVFNPARMYYFLNNHKKALAFKITKGDSVESIADKAEKCFSFTAQINGELPADSRLDALRQLVQYITRIDVNKFASDLFPSIKQDTYVCLEVDNPINFGNGVQSQQCFNAFNEFLMSKDAVKSGEKDFFGNDAAGWEFPEFKYKNIRVYSRNRNNRCYSRWGQNGAEACKIGSETRQQITSLLQFILEPVNRLTDQQPGIWYNFMLGKKQFKVMTTLMPKSQLLETDFLKDYTDNMWLQQTQTLADYYRNQSKGESVAGEIIIMSFPQGTTVLEYARTVTGDELSEKIQRWNQGLWNGVGKYHVMNIRMICDVLNRQFSYQQRKIRKAKKSVTLFNLTDTYDFFFDDPGAIAKVAKRLADFVSYCAVNKHVETPNYDLSFSVPLCMNLCLHKLNILKENYMNEWAFNLGRLFSEANYLHQMYFEKPPRCMTPPDKLIGQRFFEMATDNPQNAYELFVRAFRIYLTWGQTYVRTHQGHLGYLMSSIGELVSKINEVPFSNTPGSKICLLQGYLWRPAKKEKIVEQGPLDVADVSLNNIRVD